jgi:hypothetical protein
MLEDPETSELISWSSHGDLFSVSNPTAFSKTILPQYFKHNNWQSFVRQLNMYGFHKVNDLIHSNLTNENQTWEFKHPNFRKGAVGDLQNIKRKSAKIQQLQLQQQLQQQAQAQAQQQQQQQQQYNNNSNNNNNNYNNDSSSSASYSSHQQQQQQQQHKQQYNQQQQQQEQQQQQQTSIQDEDTMMNGDNTDSKSNNDNPVINHILRIEQHLLGVTKSCESLINEVLHLRMVVSKQQDVSILFIFRVGEGVVVQKPWFYLHFIYNRQCKI